MDKIGQPCCGNCLWYNGDMRDRQAFCDDREDYVQRNNYCHRHSRDVEANKLKE